MLSPDAPRVAVLYARDPRVLGGGSDTRAAALSRAVAQAADADLITFDRAGPPGRLAAASRGVPPRLAQQFERRRLPEVRERLRRADLVVAVTTFSLPYVPRDLWSRTVLDAHNVESRVVQQLAQHGRPFLRRTAYRLTAGWTEGWERHAARQVRQVWAVSPEEREWFQESGQRDVVLVPNGVTMPAGAAADTARDVVLVASFESVFNQDGARWFLDQVWPRIREARRDTVLVVAGRGSEQFVGDGVEALGYVPDLRAVYSRARLAIAPLRSGAGTRLKILEALAWKVPAVATTQGAEGLELVAGRHYLRADEPERFARACSDLLVDDELHHRISVSGYDAVRRTYDWKRVEAVASDQVRRLLVGERAHDGAK